ncbi:unnamed protein product [Rotaria sp. Silwood1]|nr:unnamed protein product [Rotaria sp. Silwood1]
MRGRLSLVQPGLPRARPISDETSSLASTKTHSGIVASSIRLYFKYSLFKKRMTDGDIDRDSERFKHSESYDIIDEKRWHRHPNGTCRHFYLHHHGSLGKYHGLDICRCP